jgi:hypothetical protein
VNTDAKVDVEVSRKNGTGLEYPDSSDDEVDWASKGLLSKPNPASTSARAATKPKSDDGNNIPGTVTKMTKNSEPVAKSNATAEVSGGTKYADSPFLTPVNTKRKRASTEAKMGE